MARALLLENPHKTADEVFMKNGIGIVRNPGASDEAGLIHILRGVNHLGLCSKTSVTREILEANPQLEVIGAFCIGTNQVDLEATTESSICMSNAPYSNTRSMVELATGEIIDPRRRVIVKNSRPHHGIWDKSADGAHEVRGRTLGIINCGNTGAQLSALAKVMGPDTISYNIAECLALGNATQMPTMESVLREVDIVPVHVDGQLINANLFGAHELTMMKSGVLSINLSRDFIVDIDAPHGTFVLGHLVGVAVDVFPEEPNRNNDPFTSPLTKLDSVILTPHIGSSMEETQCGTGCLVASKIADYENTGPTDMSVNLSNPQLSAPEESCYRIVLVHRNTPGVLATANNTSVQTGASISTQILGTTGQTSYVLTGTNPELPVETIEKIRSTRDTIRLIIARL